MVSPWVSDATVQGARAQGHHLPLGHEVLLPRQQLLAPLFVNGLPRGLQGQWKHTSLPGMARDGPGLGPPGGWLP